MNFDQRVQSITGWKGAPYVYEGPEPVRDSFSVRYWNAVDASMGLKAMFEEMLLRHTKFTGAEQLLILADFTAVVLNDLRTGGITEGAWLKVELFMLGECDIIVVIAHDAVPIRSDRDVENGTAAHVGYADGGRCCFLHFTHAPRG